MGHSVTVLEKEQFPRFHVGESLLPAGMPILERLGVKPQGDIYLYKRGAEFVCEETGRSQTFPFHDALPGCPEHAWHVDRADFDTQLRDVALQSGARVLHGTTVTDVEFGDSGVVVHALNETEPETLKTYQARFFLDASGQDRFLGRALDSVKPYECFGAAAVYSRFEHLSDDALEAIGEGNDVRILLRKDGWGWMIPLPGRRLSLGVVSQSKVSLESLDGEQGFLSGPLVKRWTAGATRVQTGVIRNFSYRNTQSSGSRFGVIGDAACFLDPVFSSGVVLAMRGAEDVADLLGSALDAGTEADAELLAPQHDRMDRVYRTFAQLIDRFYNTRFAETMFLNDPAGLEMRHGVMSVLAGDVWRTDNPFQELLLRADGRRTRAI